MHTRMTHRHGTPHIYRNRQHQTVDSMDRGSPVNVTLFESVLQFSKLIYSKKLELKKYVMQFIPHSDTDPRNRFSGIHIRLRLRHSYVQDISQDRIMTSTESLQYQ